MQTLSQAASPQSIAAAALNMGAKSVAFTYNDPVVFMEYAIDIADACHDVGINAIAVTAGYIEDAPRREFFQYMDAVNVDLKAFTEHFYKRVCIGHLEPVLETLEYLHNETNVWFEITNLVIPGANDSDSEFEEMSSWIVNHLGSQIPLHFTAFHPDFKMLDTPPTPPATLRRAREIALDQGVEYAYVGNTHDSEAGSTYCPRCSARVIDRDWYRISDYQLDDTGSCISCGYAINGVFDGPAQNWGRQRVPVRIGDRH